MAEVHGNRTNLENTEESKDSIKSGAESGAVGAYSGEIDADLRATIDTWATLPEADRRAILAIIRGACGTA